VTVIPSVAEEHFFNGARVFDSLRMGRVVFFSAMLLLCLNVRAVGRWLGYHVAGSRPSFSVMMQAASEINRNLPMMVGEHIQLVNVAPTPGMMVYNYRTIGVPAGRITQAGLTAAKPQAVTQVCTTPMIRDSMARLGVALRFMYVAEDGTFIGSVDVAADECAARPEQVADVQP
jgi:hypothetical protein